MMTDQNKKPVEQAELSLEVTPPEPDIAAAGSEPDEGEVLRWTCHPVLRRPLVSVGVTLFIIVCGILVNMATGSRLFTILALVILYASLTKFYFPTRYRLNRQGIQIKTTTQTLMKEWSMYRSFYPDKNGVLLSTFTRPTRLENFRGLYIMCADNRDEVIDFIKGHIGTTVTPATEDRS